VPAALITLALPCAALAGSGEYLGYAKSSSMYSNATDTVNGKPQAATVLRLQSQRFMVRSVPLGTIKAGERIKGVVPSGVSGTRYLNLVAYAQHLQTLGTAPDDNISIAPDDGRLGVQRFRPPAC
jgi:hypothetical protein